jgi:uncharacterized membrane protein
VVGDQREGGNVEDAAYALTWDATGTRVDLHPAGYYASRAFGTDGVRQVGETVTLRGEDPEEDALRHAVLWNGTPSYLDLHPTNIPGVAQSAAYGVAGNQQVGYGLVFSAVGPERRVRHAMLWNGTPDAVDLHPTNLPGVTRSFAYGTDGVSQAGYASFTDSRVHALRWRGTSEAVDLHPAGHESISDSVAYAVSGEQVVGYGQGFDSPMGGTYFHALLWDGDGAPVDLHPTALSELTSSAALGTNGTRQVGYGQIGGPAGVRHALLWDGTPAATDLHLLLPAGFVSSEANTIDAAGNVFGTALDGAGRVHAIEWSVPEPAAASLLPAVGLALLRRRRR